MAKTKSPKIPADLCYNYPLEWYTDANNVPNQQSQSEIIQWFSTGPGARLFAPIEILNLLYKQVDFVSQNIYDGDKVESHLTDLPLTDLQKHVLFGLILKKFGGYPIHLAEREQEKTIKRVEQLFLSGEKDSPEREFCKTDMDTRKEFMKLGLAFTTSIRTGIDVREILAEMDETTAEPVYRNFEDLFDDAALKGGVGPFHPQSRYLIERTRYNFTFNTWLIDHKGWPHGDEVAYRQFLNRLTFVEYLKYEKDQVALNNKLLAADKQRWTVGDTDVQAPDTETEDDKSVLVRKHLSKFIDLFNSGEELNRAITIITEFLNIAKVTKTKQIFVKNGSKRKFAYAFSQIWKETSNEAIPLKYLKLCKNSFSIFAKEDIDEKNYKSSNLYKYFITKT
ncbi:hypothetical protein [Chitinophaga sp. ARDCPP14]|uniref:hypothetical protein n=1 Tax=Chitinophaga sp. ARDCPP14 TaxID=3391139 RepID=UPI003F527E24